MSKGLRSAVAIATVTVAAGMSNSAHATVTFCNHYERTIYVAIAYPQEEYDDEWISRGWLELDPDSCSAFDSALRLKTFYYRAESVPFGGQIYTWGKDRNFAIYEDANFNYWGAQARVLKSELREFSKGPATNGDDLTVTMTFQEGSVTTTFVNDKE